MTINKFILKNMLDVRWYNLKRCWINEAVPIIPRLGRMDTEAMTSLSTCLCPQPRRKDSSIISIYSLEVIPNITLQAYILKLIPKIFFQILTFLDKNLKIYFFFLVVRFRSHEAGISFQYWEGSPFRSIYIKL